MNAKERQEVDWGVAHWPGTRSWSSVQPNGLICILLCLEKFLLGLKGKGGEGWGEEVTFRVVAIALQGFGKFLHKRVPRVIMHGFIGKEYFYLP
ncbi:hypothetical protein AMTR_s00019p00246650 [Amborella trichopoda]|uniref:Uncharacterized protein n=1 Tax=Amborella trichopoda TaxID=13333 RepID=W1PI59_AMBTC|nr:hypothetical protein AMTR_s00019p00246650 [Amborella trichopoda]